MGKKKRPYRTMKEFPPNLKCAFCLQSTADLGVLGEIHQIADIFLHYLCLLSASDVEQKGTDDDGLLGFYARDIRNEIGRVEKHKCFYCKKKGASVICSGPKCGLRFHLPCGLQNGSLHQYYDGFRSFCKKHKPQQKIPKELNKLKKLNCPICMEAVSRSKEAYIWPTCCKPISSLIHKTCCQLMALNSGYSMKCPLCNNKDTFGASVRAFGIYVPDQEATWERDIAGNRLDDSNTLSCLASFNNKCQCPHGPKYSLRASKKWYIEVCDYCGSGMHLGCMPVPLVGRRGFKCDSCAAVIKGPLVPRQDPPPMEVEVVENEDNMEDNEDNMEDNEDNLEDDRIDEIALFRAAVGLEVYEENNVERVEAARSSRTRSRKRINSRPQPPVENVETIVISDSSDDESTPSVPPKRPFLIPPRRPALCCPHYKPGQDCGVRTVYFLLTDITDLNVLENVDSPEDSRHGITDKGTPKAHKC